MVVRPGPCVLLVTLTNEGLHRDGDKVQLEMKTERVFSPSDRRVTDLVCSELKLHPENGGALVASFP